MGTLVRYRTSVLLSLRDKSTQKDSFARERQGIVLGLIVILIYTGIIPPALLEAIFLCINVYEILVIFVKTNKVQTAVCTVPALSNIRTLNGRWIAIISLSVYSIMGTKAICSYNDDTRLSSGLLIVACVSISDILQYYSGKILGYTKPLTISPNKTIEGYLVGTSITIFIFFVTPFSKVSLLKIIMWVVSGVLGDLYVSYNKRILGIKDISNLLGSHGGWLDRMDGVYGAIMTDTIYELITTVLQSNSFPAAP